MTIDFSTLLAPGIAQIHAYEPGKPIEELERELGDALPEGGIFKLASNENPIGPSPRALAAAAAALPQVHRYPDGAAFGLRRRLAAELGVGDRELVLGNGSNELLDLVVRTFASATRDDEVLSPERSFACYPLSAQMHGVRYVEARRNADLSYDAGALLAAVTPRTRVLFLANPCNPTGTHLAAPALRRLARELPEHVLLVLDEAYVEYADAADYVDGMKLRGERELLVVMRTFSKIHGLAGLRCGYAVAPAAVAGFIERVRNPFNVGSVAQAACAAALDDTEHVARARAVNREGLDQIRAGLDRLGVRYAPTQTNFLLVDLAPLEGRAVFGELLRKGVIVRPLGGYKLPHHVRVSVGLPTENARFLDALAQVLGGRTSA